MRARSSATASLRAQLVLALEQLGARRQRVGAQLAPAHGAADEHHRERSETTVKMHRRLDVRAPGRA